MHILLTGATGYVGGRLVPRLLEAGHTVRVLVRDPNRLLRRPWAAQVEMVHGDLLEPASLRGVGDGIDVAYYLVHSMMTESDFAASDRMAARNFVGAMADATLHVIYLGGIVPRGGTVSSHLRSRAEVGDILRAGLATTEFRAGPIIGSGSASFEMVRYLTDRLPAMIAPRWILNDVQPLAIQDLLAYLLAALEREPLGIVDLGSDRLTFKAMMQQYAEIRGLRRVILPVPVLAPALAALWVGFVTPIPNRLAVPLVQGIVTSVTADTHRAALLFPDITSMPYREAVTLALRSVERGDVETRWSGALGLSPSYELTDQEGVIREVHAVHVNTIPERVYAVYTSLGGEHGWYAWNWAWTVRGMLDRLVGGPGLRRGRRHPDELLPGEALDFWRVETIDPPRTLRLYAEMKVPGHAWLQWESVPDGTGTRLVQTATFIPKGLFGTLYWYVLYPVHRQIFRALIYTIAQRAEREEHHFSRPVSEKRPASTKRRESAAG